MEEIFPWIIDQCKHVDAQPIVHLQVSTEREGCGGLRESLLSQNHNFRGLSSAFQGLKEIFAQRFKIEFAIDEPVEFTIAA
jgi:hypothetical protein